VLNLGCMVEGVMHGYVGHMAYSATALKPLPLTNGHSRYIAVTPGRKLASVGGWPLHITVINF
jgi:hypothetical protein